MRTWANKPPNSTENLLDEAQQMIDIRTAEYKILISSEFHLSFGTVEKAPKVSSTWGAYH
jgi:hypothetical protein